MRPIVITEFISLDGVVEAPGGGDHEHAGWTFKDVEFDPAAYEIKGREQQDAAALLLGRVSFEEFAPVWPSMDEFATYNALPKFVMSTTLTQDAVTASGWVHSHLLTSLDDVRALRDGNHGDGSRFSDVTDGPVLVHGSPTLAASLASAGLVDRYTLLTFPVVLGGGKRLFADDGIKTRLTLIESQQFDNGIHLAVFDVVR